MDSQPSFLMGRVSQKTAYARHRIYYKAWTCPSIHAKIFINFPVAIGRRIIRGNIGHWTHTNRIYYDYFIDSLSIRPDTSNSLDWFSEKQTKVLRTIRTFLQSNGTAKEPNAVNQTRLMYQACMNTSTAANLSHCLKWLVILSINIIISNWFIQQHKWIALDFAHYWTIWRWLICRNVRRCWRMRQMEKMRHSIGWKQ